MFYFRHVISLDTFYEDKDDSVHILLSGSNNKTVLQWHVNPNMEEKKMLKYLPIYSVFWNKHKSKLAIVDEGNNINLNEDKQVQLNKGNPITKIVYYSNDKLVYALRNGDVVRYSCIKEDSQSIIMNLGGQVQILKYIKEVGAVVASSGGCLKLYSHKKTFTLTNEESFVDCFNTQLPGILLAVTKMGKILIWNTKTKTHHIANENLIIEKCHFTQVTMAVLSKCQTKLAITTTDKTFQVYAIKYTKDFVDVKLLISEASDNTLLCSAFSFNSKFLVLAGEQGHIEVLNLV